MLRHEFFFIWAGNEEKGCKKMNTGFFCQFFLFKRNRI